MSREQRLDKRVVFTGDSTLSAADREMFPIAVRPASLRLLWLGLGVLLVTLIVLAVAIGRIL